MFSCRRRVELVAAGSRSPCGRSVRVSLRVAAGSPPQGHGLRPLKGPAQDGSFSYRLWPHVLRILELLLLVVMPLGQDVEQQQVTENRGLGAGRWWIEHAPGVRDRTPP